MISSVVLTQYQCVMDKPNHSVSIALFMAVLCWHAIKISGACERGMNDVECSCSLSLMSTGCRSLRVMLWWPCSVSCFNTTDTTRPSVIGACQNCLLDFSPAWRLIPPVMSGNNCEVLVCVHVSFLVLTLLVQRQEGQKHPPLSLDVFFSPSWSNSEKEGWLNHQKALQDDWWSLPPACTASLIFGSSKALWPWPWLWIWSRSYQHAQYL